MFSHRKESTLMDYARQVGLECCYALATDEPLIGRLRGCEASLLKLTHGNTPATLQPIIADYQRRLSEVSHMSGTERHRLASDLLTDYWGSVCGGMV